MQPFANALRSIFAVFWIGGLWVAGVVVAPILFRELDTASAGHVAGVMFRAMAWIGMIAGVYLIIHLIWQDGLRAFREMDFWLVLVMLGLTLLNHFVIFPVIADLKNRMQSVAEGLFGGGFQSWHALSSLVYLVQAIFGLVYIGRARSV